MRLVKRPFFDGYKNDFRVLKIADYDFKGNIIKDKK